MREPVTIIEIDQVVCKNRWGVSPCEAELSTVFPHKCFNTRATCADPDNFDILTDTDDPPEVERTEETEANWDAGTHEGTIADGDDLIIDWWE